jgi:hypothetical protein
MLDWPPHSLELSPIEMLWSLIKRRLKGRRFENENELFIAIETAWNEVPMSVINNLVERLKARLQVCLELAGEYLNDHWNRVHQFHHLMDPDHVPVEAMEVEG